MGWTFYGISSLPEVHDIVWCKWPQREDRNMPGRIARPVLVRETEILQKGRVQYGAVVISYASGQGIDAAARLVDLCIENPADVKAAGLHKPTRFSLAPTDKKRLPWCEEYFVAPQFVRNMRLVLGKLTDQQRERMRGCLIRRGQRR
jgi:hypothetical protein